MADDTTTEFLTLPEVARRLGVSPRTLQRREDELMSAGAVRTGAGWKIPADAVEGLSRVALKRRQKTSDTRHTSDTTTRQTSDARQEDTDSPTTQAMIELAELRAVVSQQRERIAYLERQNLELIATNQQVASANAATALSLRESLTRIERQPSERHEEAPSRPDERPEVFSGVLRAFRRRRG